jgi:hypothetical protein
MVVLMASILVVGLVGRVENLAGVSVVGMALNTGIEVVERRVV